MLRDVNQPLVSVIVPVYNAEKYLIRCIESILHQTYGNIELILVNDGSLDRSEKICDHYACADSRIVYVSQDNCGQSVARKKGIELSHGDYIAFVDADDYILPLMYETMLKNLLENNADVCVCQWNYELPDGRHTIDKNSIDPALFGLHGSIEFAHYLYMPYQGGYLNGVVVAPWNKLYRKQVLIGADFQKRFAEDEYMNDSIFCTNCKVIVIPEEFYFWCQNLASVSNSTFNEYRLDTLDMLLQRKERYYGDAFLVSKTEKLYCNLFVEYYYKARNNRITIPRYLHSKFLKMFGFHFLHTISLFSDVKFFIRMSIFSISPKLYEYFFMS